VYLGFFCYSSRKFKIQVISTNWLCTQILYRDFKQVVVAFLRYSNFSVGDLKVCRVFREGTFVNRDAFNLIQCSSLSPLFPFLKEFDGVPMGIIVDEFGAILAQPYSVLRGPAAVGS